jgi:hypothetical protein
MRSRWSDRGVHDGRNTHPDLAPRTRHPQEGVRGRERVGCLAVNVDANLTEEAPQVLGVVVDISRPAAVADTDVQVAVRAERELTPVVVAE